MAWLCMSGVVQEGISLHEEYDGEKMREETYYFLFMKTGDVSLGLSGA